MASARVFNKASTCDEVLAGLDLRGKHAIVTGASGGLGEETARAVAAAGASVTIVARNLEKANSVAEKIRTGHPSCGAIDVMQAELAEPESARQFGEEWRKSSRSIDLLFLNAGIMACPRNQTKEGWELQFATNHLGHFLLTALVAPSLRPGARIVVTSSAAHEFAPVDLEDLHFTNRPYTPWTAYGQSKTANVLFAIGLDRRLAARGVRAFAVHPGGIMTELGRHMDGDSMKEMQSLAKTSAERKRAKETPQSSKAKPRGGLEFKSIEAGAATQVWTATAPELDGRGGLYCEDCAVGEAVDWAMDQRAADGLWEISEKLLSCSFPLGDSAKL